MINYCDSNPCQNGALGCDPVPNGYVCRCNVRFSGSHCETKLVDAPCLSNPCQRNTTCHDLGLDYRCLCPPGITGKNCEIDRNLTCRWERKPKTTIYGLDQKTIEGANVSYCKMACEKEHTFFCRSFEFWTGQKPGRCVLSSNSSRDPNVNLVEISYVDLYDHICGK